MNETLTGRCSYTIAGWVSRSRFGHKEVLAQVPHQLLWEVYRYVVNMGNDTLELYLLFLQLEARDMPQHFSQKLSIRDVSVVELSHLLGGSATKLPLDLQVHACRDVDDMRQLVDLQCLHGLSVMCPVGDLILSYWITRLKNLKGKWTQLKWLVVPTSVSAMHVYKLLEAIPSLETIACGLDADHVRQVPQLRKRLHLTDPLIKTESQIQIALLPERFTTSRPSYKATVNPVTISDTHSVYQVTPIDTVSTSNMRKRPRLNTKRISASQYFGI